VEAAEFKTAEEQKGVKWHVIGATMLLWFLNPCMVTHHMVVCLDDMAPLELAASLVSLHLFAAVDSSG
jgi:hypothetical protein